MNLLYLTLTIIVHTTIVQSRSPLLVSFQKRLVGFSVGITVISINSGAILNSICKGNLPLILTRKDDNVKCYSYHLEIGTIRVNDMWQAQLLALIEGNSHSIPFLLVVLNAYLYVDPYITLLRNQARLYMLKVDIKEDEQVPGLTFDFVITGLIKSVCTRFSIIFVFDGKRVMSCSTSCLLFVQTPHNDVNLWSIVGLPVVVGCDFLTNICARDPFVHANTSKQRRTWRTH